MSLGVGKLMTAKGCDSSINLCVGDAYNGGYYIGNHTIGANTYKIILSRKSDVYTDYAIWNTTGTYLYEPYFYDHISSSTSASDAGTSTSDGWLNSAQYSNGDGSWMNSGNLFWTDVSSVPGNANFYWWDYNEVGYTPGYGLVTGAGGNRKYIAVGSTLNGYDDWYWPSKDELTLASYARHRMPVSEDFSNDLHSSSTSSGSSHWILNPTNNDMNQVSISTTANPNPPLEFHIRAVRRELI